MGAVASAALAFLEKGAPGDEKHLGVAHALATWVVFHVAVLGTGLLADGALEAALGPGRGGGELPPAPAATLLLAGYWAALAGMRLSLERRGGRAGVLYELVWSCTACLLFGACAVWQRRAPLLCAQGVLVAIDQVLWYVDLAGYAATGKLPLKVCGYLFWPSTPIAKKVTSLHHLVFVPLVVALCARGGGVPLGRGFLISAAQTVSCQAVCRFTTPLELPSEQGQDEPRYLNLNLCYESFRGVKVAWIRRHDRARPAVYLPWMLWIWNLGNLLLFAALAGALLVPLRALAALPGARFTF